MMKTISMLKSGTLRGLAVAAIAYGLQLLGLSEQFPSAEGVIDGLLKFVEIAGMVYAAAKRTFSPNPPLTEAAVAKTNSMVAAGTLEVQK